MIEVVEKAIVRQPIGDVFDSVTTIANWPIIDPMMGPMLEHPPAHPTSSGETFVGIGRVGPMQSRMLWTVTECRRPQRWVGELRPIKVNRLVDFGTITTTYEFSEAEDGTHVELRCAWDPHALARVVSRVYLEGYEQKMARHMVTNLKRTLESGWQPNDGHHH